MFLHLSLSFFIHVKQILQNDYVKENQPIFSQSRHDIYLSITIHISGSSEPKIIAERTGHIETDLDRNRHRETDSFRERQIDLQ